MGMRAFLGLFVASLALAAPVSALGAEDLDDALALHRLNLVVPLGEPVSLNEALQRSVPTTLPGTDPVTGGPALLATSGAGPSAGAPSAQAAGSEALLWLLGFGGLATGIGVGWRHLHPRNVLDHPTRLGLLALLRAQPGLHLRGVARAAGLPVQRAAYHLDTLERLGLVASQDIGGKRCYFEAGAGAQVRRALQEAALEPGAVARDVLAFIHAHPGANQSEVARELGLLPGRARWHLQRLAAQGRLDEARVGKALTYHPRGPGASTGLRP